MGVFYTLNHPFFFYRGQVPLETYLRAMLDEFPGVEARNGTMLAPHNALVERRILTNGVGRRNSDSKTGGHRRA